MRLTDGLQVCKAGGEEFGLQLRVIAARKLIELTIDAGSNNNISKIAGPGQAAPVIKLNVA